MTISAVLCQTNWIARMGSWTLLRTFIAWETLPTTQSPIFKRESDQSPLWQSRRLSFPRVPALLLITASVALVLAVQLIDVPLVSRCANAGLMVIGPPLLLLPSLVLWVVPLGVVFAPIIVRERHSGNWEILRATPFSVEELLLNKAGGALWRLRRLLVSLGGLQAQILAAVLLSLGLIQFLDALNNLPEERFGAIDRSVLCIGGVVLLGVIAGLFLLDRLQQLIVMIVAALALSTSSGSTQMALTRAVAATFLTWVVDVAVAVLALILQPAGQVQDFVYSTAAIVMLGPIAGYVIELPLVDVALLILATFTVREIAVRGLWRIAVRGASKL